MPDYWLDLFTGTTWNEFRAAGAQISGFRARRSKTVKGIKPGDILLCYLTGVMRWVGALEVIGPSDDTSPIWKLNDFTERLKVRPIILLEPEYGVPMDALEGKVDFYQDASYRKFFKGFLRGSPNKFAVNADGDLIMGLLKEAQEHPVKREVDAKLMARIPLYRIADRGKGTTGKTVVSIPETEVQKEEAEGIEIPIEPEVSDHTRIQYYLLTLGADLGLNIWVARNDRNKTYNGQLLGELPNIVSELPSQFNEATQRTIELIDVLWIKGNSIVAAFEVESTTSIYSGLLRMSDLLALQPNLNIKLFLVASEDRKIKVKQEILRPTFELSQKPLSKVCGFISFSKLVEKVDGIHKLGIVSTIKPDFIDLTAEYFKAE